MKIVSLYIENLFGCREPIFIDFNKNIHVISGKNGAGKTTILKLVWYFISGNLEKALIEVPFQRAILTTDLYILEVNVTDDTDNPFTTKIEYINKKLISEDVVDIDPKSLPEHIRHILTKFIGSSFFFPTFRNIEGGFTTEKYSFKHEVFKRILTNKSPSNEAESVDLIKDLSVISSKLSEEEHNFITSVSSSHINKFLISKYAEIMSLQQPYQAKRKDLTDQFIKTYIFSTDNNNKVTLIPKDEELVDTLKAKINEVEEQINSIQKPLKRFHDSIRFFLKDYKFHFSKNVQFSKISDKINEEILDIRDPKFLNFKIDNTEIELFDISLLSAGEKQILTLISYNSFIDNTIFFIDEPEISLHADWQRILFRILMKQNPTNQFIISTQSPFIYSKYPKNEICIDPTSDRGNSEE